eukprot:2616035-Alexandrium_andersonii.AAC.1
MGSTGRQSVPVQRGSRAARATQSQVEVNLNPAEPSSAASSSDAVPATEPCDPVQSAVAEPVPPCDSDGGSATGPAQLLRARVRKLQRLLKRQKNQAAYWK